MVNNIVNTPSRQLLQQTLAEVLNGLLKHQSSQLPKQALEGMENLKP
jgi:hypothetical protein